MKKKVKLFTTIASLCLAVALMAFGVYAATSVTLGISSKVSFTVSDVFVDVTGAAYLDPVASKGTTTAGTQYATKQSYTGSVATDSGKPTLALQAWDIGTIAFTSTNDCIVYKLTIANVAQSGSVNVTVDALPIEITGTTVANKYQIDEDQEKDLTTSAIEVAAQSTIVITITRTLTVKDTNITATDSWKPNVTIANKG